MAKDETKVKGYYNNSLSRPEEKFSGEGSSCGMSLQGHLILGFMKEHFVLNDPVVVCVFFFVSLTLSL